MLERKFGFLELRSREVPEASHTLQELGYVVLPQVFSPEEVENLRADIERVFDEFPPDPPPSADGPGAARSNVAGNRKTPPTFTPR